jgi:ABC-type sugar transport system permease subunit
MNKQFCGGCGKRNAENSNFCEGCGNNFEQGNPLSLTNQPVMAGNQTYAQSGSQSDELFSSITDESATSVDSSANNVIIGICCVISLFFGGLISAGIAGLIYLPFRRRANGWIFFVIPYIVIAFILTVTLSR